MNKTVITIISALVILVIIISLVLLFRPSRQSLRYKDQSFSVEFSKDASIITDPTTGRNYLTSKELNMGFGIGDSTTQKDCGQSGSRIYQQINISGNLYSLCAATNKETRKPSIWTINFAINGKWYNATLIPNNVNSVLTQKQAEEILSSIQAEK